ncbi:MAG: GEVED domain-containing protein [Bacteroidota bacterium]
MKNILFTILLVALSGLPQWATAQQQSSPKLQETATEAEPSYLTPCATHDMTEEEKRYTLEVVDKAGADRNAGTTCLPLRIHIVTLDDGTGGISLEEINIGMSYLNSFYLPASIEYYICSVNYIASTAWYNFSTSEEAALRAAHLQDDAINIFFVESISVGSGGACGYAYYPSNNDRSLTILMDNDCTARYPNGTLVHELGHTFNLAHTHNGTTSGNTNSNAEHVPRTGPNSNCATNGDFLCDTEADPNGSNSSSCAFVNNGNSTQDIFGNTYAPDLDNVMSYYSDYCGGRFTPGQYTRIANALVTRQGHSAYNLTGCPPNVVADASGLTAAVNASYSVDLNWMDNANNETGYLIERSTDGGTTWLAIVGGGVAPDVTTFTDTDVQANSTYQYRVKASNDDCSHYSNVASITTGLLYCIPGHQSNSCTVGNGGNLGVAIYDFELSESGAGGSTLISNPGNGCNGPLSVFVSSDSATVMAGSTYDIEVDFRNLPSTSYYGQYFTVWVDLDRNGSFTDAGEMLYQSASAGGPTRSGSITIPASATAGKTTLRVRSGWQGNGIMDDPCDYNSFSEAEDYGLIIQAGGVELSTKAFLEGPYSSGSMTDGLRSGGSIPTTEPYSSLANYTHVGGGGGETVSAPVLAVTGNDAIIDWVFIELRDKNDPTQVLYTRSALLQSDGDIVDTEGGNSMVSFANAPADDYYLVIRHRNHLGVMTASAISLDGMPGSVTDFSNPATPTYSLGASATKDMNGTRVLYGGDASMDGFVSASDQNLNWRVQNGGTFDYMTSTADFNMDGFVSASDLNLIWRPNNSVTQQLP